MLLALLITEYREPIPVDVPFYAGIQEVGVIESSRFSHPSYHHRPFLRFLQLSPKEGLRTIVRLVNHATSRLCESQNRTNPYAINKSGCDVFGNGTLLEGETECLYWNRGTTGISDVVTSALMALEKWLTLHLDEDIPIDRPVAQIVEETTSVAAVGVLVDVGRRQPGLFGGILKPLLSVPEVFIFDGIFQHTGLGRFGFGFDTRYGEEYFNEHRDWITAPYRNTSLLQIARDLFGTDPGFRSSQIAARNEWIQRIEQEREGVFRSGLELLCRTFDPTVWTCESSQDGIDTWTLTQPDIFGRTTVEDVQDDISAVDACKEIIDWCCRSISDSRPFSVQALEEMWQRMPLVEAELVNEKEHATLLSHARAALAVASHSMHSDWLDERADELVQSYESLLQFAPEVQAGVDHIDIDFDEEQVRASFLTRETARLAPSIWATAPSDDQYRNWIAFLATHCGPAVSEIVVTAAAENRDSLGRSFQQLVHFVLRFAAAHSVWDPEYPGERNGFNLDRWYAKEKKTFVAGSLSPEIPAFKHLWHSEPLVRYANHRGYDGDTYFLRPPMTLEFVKAAVSWIPSFREAQTAAARDTWSLLLSESISLSLMIAQVRNRNGEVLPPVRHGGGRPFVFDKWLFGHAASIVANAIDAESVRPIWQPVIALGRQCAGWVQAFLRPWFKGTLEATNPEAFSEIWSEMAAVALQSESWMEFESSGGLHGDDLWCDLLGVDPYTQLFWNESHRPVAEAARDWYAPVAKQVLIRPDVADHLIRWMLCPAADLLRANCLTWIWDIAVARPKWLDREAGLENLIAQLLDQYWAENADVAMAETGDSRTFRELLRILAERQNEVAMDLEDRVARGLL